MATIPAGVYGLRVPAGGEPIPASMNPNVAFRITMAAIDPTVQALDGPARATLKLIRVQDDDEDDEDDDFDPDNIEELRAKLLADGVLGSDDDSEDEESEDEKNGGPSDPQRSKQAKRDALQKKLQEDADAEEMEIDQLSKSVNGSKGKGKALVSDEDDDSEDSDLDDDDEPEELVLCTLDPDKHYQQTLEITVREGEEIYFSATGSHDIYLTGNYVAFPDDDDEDDDDAADMYGLDAADYDEDEDDFDEDISDSDEDELDALADPRITEIESEEEAPKLVKATKKGKNKRQAEDDDQSEAMTLDELITKTKADAPIANSDEKPNKKQAKKLKNNDGQAVAAAAAPTESKKETKKVDTPNSDKKKVQFAKNLEQGPTGSPKVAEPKKESAKGPRNVGGVTVEDKKEGKGRPAKRGDRIEMRYIGKLKNGKQFDANKKGKPFSFKLGVGEVIKGWDIGVAGMQAGSERRLSIPAKLAYGSKALPGIPANSELIFDIKCISVS